MYKIEIKDRFTKGLQRRVVPFTLSANGVFIVIGKSVEASEKQKRTFIKKDVMMTKKNTLSIKSTKISSFKRFACLFSFTLLGSLPAHADTIYANGFGIPVDQPVAVGSDCYVYAVPVHKEQW